MRPIVGFGILLGACDGLTATAPRVSAAGRAAIAGPVGPAGEAGPAGPPGSSGEGQAFHWVDSTALAVTSGMPLTWIDPDTGWIWAVDAETGLLDSVSAEQLVHYTDLACTTGERVIAPVPEAPFRLHDSNGLLVVRPQSAPGTWDCARSKWFLGSCVPINLCVNRWWVETQHLVTTGVASAPASPWVGPLHLER